MAFIVGPGCTVVCKVKNSIVVESYYLEYDDKITLEIVSNGSGGWHAYIPPYICIKNTIKVTQRNYKSLALDKKYIGDEVLFITNSFIDKVSYVPDGMVCQKCNEFFSFAEPNQTDGTMICWLCRNYPHYR